MTNNDDNRVAPADQSAPPAPKKSYQTPEVAVHGRVDEITQMLLAITHH
ncbi:MAG: hypothetical protein LAP40_19785 [Acidobacteriia bacterium]|nr:hypothetical protein [Terriglobia bacterium]